MEHTKKMLLIPQEAVQRLTKENTALSKIDREMWDILHSKLTDDEKWTKYQQVLNQYLHLTQNERQPVQLTIDNDKVNDNFEINEQQDSFKPLLLHTVPKQYKTKASQLYDIIKKSDDIAWTKKGSLTINNTEIKDTNIIDLVSDALRARKGFHPTGWQDFAVAIKKLNLPRELVGNPKFRDYQPTQTGSGFTSLKKPAVHKIINLKHINVQSKPKQRVNPIKRLKWQTFNF